MIELVFWLAVATVVYTYALFPLLVFARGRLAPRPHASAPGTPGVSILIAARNEEAGIAAKLDNLLELDYPADWLQIVIVSDGSDDGTDDIVARYLDRGVELVPLPRVGKAAALNAAAARARGEILVFSDANSMFARDAVRALVAPFADPAVGGVAGNQCYAAGGDATTAAGERGYWSFDTALKRAESAAGNVISATGAIYAIRRDLFRPVPEGVTDDFVTSTRVIAQGYRLVFAQDAVATEPVGASAEVEFGRKVRVMTRGLRSVLVMRELLNPFRHGFYALQLLSHKVLRRLSVVPLLAIAVSSPFLWGSGLPYREATAAQALLYGLGGAGILFRRTAVGRWWPLAIPAFFCLVNVAALRALWNLVSGRRIERWEPERA